MSTFGEELVKSLEEALAHAKGEGPAIVHTTVTPRQVRLQAHLTQAQMAPLMGMSLSGYRKWEQGTRNVSGPAEALLRVIQKEPEAVRRALYARASTPTTRTAATSGTAPAKPSSTTTSPRRSPSTGLTRRAENRAPQFVVEFTDDDISLLLSSGPATVAAVRAKIIRH